MNFFLAILLCAACGMIGFHCWTPLMRDSSDRNKHWFLGWLIKGMVVPCVIWMAFNSGFLPKIGFFMTEPAVVRAAKGPWLITMTEVMGKGFFVISSFWGAMTMGWAFLALRRKIPDENRNAFKAIMRFWFIVLLLPAYMLIWGGYWDCIGLAIMVWLFPTIYFSLPLLTLEDEVPVYAGAIGKMKFGKLEEAEWEVIQQLERCEDDFTGWMLLAELYAEHFKDLAVTERTVRELIDQPNINPSQVSVALHKLADWHLKIAEDPYGARCAMETICRRYPGSHLAKMAQHRIAQMPQTKEALLKGKEVRTIKLNPVRDFVEMTPEVPSPQMLHDQAVATARMLVDKLSRQPDDIGSREKLARIFAEELDEVQNGIDQLQLLIDLPDQPESKMIEWLAQVGRWQLGKANDVERGRRTLERLVSEYPGSPEAFSAQRRLSLMEYEDRIRRSRAAVLRRMERLSGKES